MMHSENDLERPVAVVDSDLMDLIPRYLERRQEDIDVMRNALAERDMETLRLFSHRMRGSGGGYGFDGVTQIATTIEAAANVGDCAAISAGLDDLARYLEQVEVVCGE